MLHRRLAVTVFAILALSLVQDLLRSEDLPVGSAPAPVAVPHFPDRVHTFVWRNWDVVDVERLARVLGTSTENVLAIGASMGLPPAKPFPPEFQRRGYITALRRNWHLLPYDQLLELLGMTADELAFSLREDDFLWIKLGSLKPRCERLEYSPPDAAARRRTAEIRSVVERAFGGEIRAPAEPRFRFVSRLSQPLPAAKRESPAGERRFAFRYIYSYFAPFGDPLRDAGSDPYPDGLLDRLAAVGVDGVWLHIVLRDLAPGGSDFPEFGEGSETRLENLRRLVDRARERGIGVYLYLNEPRSMPASFFEKRPEMAGVREGHTVAMCTSHPAVRRWITAALSHVFRRVPNLAGVFTITASENLTSCASHGRWKSCAHCASRTDAEIIAEVNAAVEAGVHAASPAARVIAWDWGWKGHGDAPDIIARLPDDVWLMSVSEWAVPIERGGVKSTVGEYSMSVVGPGPRALRHWKLASERGLRTVAKVQLGNTWELSAVPYLPVMNLVAEHCRRLAAAGVDGVMLSWSLGGYPSPNLQIAERFSRLPTPTVDEALDELARERFGAAGAPGAREAWQAFSTAFQEFPYGGGVLYRCPAQYGPSNLLHPEPTGYAATMIGFPYDDVNGWRGPYPPKVFAAQFEAIAKGWGRGLEALAAAVELAPAAQRESVETELRFARAASLHFRTVANQTRFVLARDALAAAAGRSSVERQPFLEELRRILDDEIEIARDLYTLARIDSRIGFEATNHYYYVPLDLVEKIVSCQWLLRHYREGAGE